MLKITRKAPGVDGSVVAGNILTWRLPIGLTHNQFYIEYAFLATATPVAWENAVGLVEIEANGKPIWAIQASELDIKSQFEGRNAFGGIATLDFDRYNLRTRNAEEFTSLGTGDREDTSPLTTLTVKLTLKSGSGVTSGTLTARMRQSDPRKLGLFKKVRRFSHSFAGAGTFEIDDFPKGDLINAIYHFESANDIDDIRMERDNFIVFDRTKELNSRIQSDGVRVPQANLFVIDTSEDGNGTDQLTTRNVDGSKVNDLREYITMDGAMTISSIVEYIGTLES
jgi:hypothetical protein